MRIGIDIRALMEGKITGVQVYILNLLKALFEIDKENEYVLFGNGFGSSTPSLSSSQSSDETSPSHEGERERVTYKLFHYPNKLFIPAQKYLGFPKVDKLLEGVDLFFSPHWRIVALNSNIPLVITFHDLSFEIVPEFFTLKQRLWHKFMDYRSAAQRANRIIAVSESTKQDLVDLYRVPESKIRVIYPGVRPPLHLSLPAARGQGEKDRGYFLCFGTFEPRKNIESVLAAYEQYHVLSTVKRSLILAGSAGWKTTIKIPPKLRGKISIFREVNEKRKAQLYQNAFALLFLSFYEGFGFPILEAAASGVPVISSFATSLQEIGHDFVLLVNPFRANQVAEAMLALENEPDFYDRLRARGHVAARQFSWERAARETVEVFEKLRMI